MKKKLKQEIKLESQYKVRFKYKNNLCLSFVKNFTYEYLETRNRYLGSFKVYLF